MAIYNKSKRGFPRSGKTVFPAREVRATLLEGFECFCSRASSNIARDARMPLLESFESPYLRVLIRADRGSRLARDDGRLSGECAYPTQASVVASIF